MRLSRLKRSITVAQDFYLGEINLTPHGALQKLPLRCANAYGNKIILHLQGGALVPLCPECKIEVGEGDIYCRNCGVALVPIPGKGMVHNFMRGVSVLFGTLFFLFSLSAGFPYYLESGLLSVLFFEALSFLISVLLLLLGLVPDTMAESLGYRIKLTENYIELVTALIIALVLIAAVEPSPSPGWVIY